MAVLQAEDAAAAANRTDLVLKVLGDAIATATTGEPSPVRARSFGAPWMLIVCIAASAYTAGPEAIALRAAAVQLYAQLPASSYLLKAIRWLDDAVRAARKVGALAHGDCMSWPGLV